MTTVPLPNQPSFLKKSLFPGLTVAGALLLGIMLFSLFLHLYDIQAMGDANAYYTAAVKSMLQSWSNFFFVAAEPGGSVTVDKPPLGLWIEALFAYFLGVSGFSVSLPNILAGVLGLPLLYGMVKKHMGELAGLTAALVMALTPVFVATNRNNTMDGLLVFFLLMAAWAFLRATETGKLRWLLLGAFIVGLGFNIKMMQAFLPLPAFYALYFFGAKIGWGQKILHLGAASVLLLVVSLAWVVAVDLTPADARPYIGSSGDNSVMGLITGHNGASRLFGGFFGPRGNPPAGENASAPGADSAAGRGLPPQPGVRQGPPPAALQACANSTPGAACSFSAQNGSAVNGACVLPPNQTALACAPQGQIPPAGLRPAGAQGVPPGGGPQAPGGGTPFSQETGAPGVFRFFTSPLSRQMSWLLPFALISVLLALFGARVKLPVEAGVHQALILWGGWLLTCVVFFSMISGIFHSYYAIMLAPALGAMVGVGFAWLWQARQNWAGAALALSAALTIAFQYFAVSQYGAFSGWMLVSGVLLGLGSLALIFRRRLAYLTILAAMLVIPLYWTVMTVTAGADVNLPTAYIGSLQAGQPRPQNGGANNEALLTYLSANTDGVKYLAAVPSSQQGATLVLATGRPVLYMGGFAGQDEVVSVEDLSALVAKGELRYVLYGGERGSKAEIVSWLKNACSPVPGFGNLSAGNTSLALYQCR
ncbi:MAG: glycosyltransferase family 39 protein [Anaerolineales bacterium]